MRPWPLMLLLCAASAHASDAERVFDRVRASVVTITTFDERNQIDGEGSGVVVAHAQVITNCHVVREASSIRVRVGDKELPASVALEDVSRDLCALEVPGLSAPAVKTRGYRDVQVGEPAYAVGNPLGFGLAVSAGLVSAIGQHKNESQIFTSAPISPGSSGGGLFDTQGRLIGITTRFFGNAQNFNVALPADWITELPRHGTHPRQAAGVMGSDPDWLDRAESLRLSAQWVQLAEWARRWRESYPTSAMAGTFLGQALSNMNQPQEAKQVLQTALQQDPRYALALSYLAMVRRELGEKNAALEDLRRVLILQPSAGYFWAILAKWQRDDGAIDEALRSVQSVIRFSPWQWEGWEVLGELRYRQQRYNEAIEAFRAVLRLKPNDPLVTSNLAAALAALDDTNAARKVLATNPGGQATDASTWVRLGVTEEKQGHYPQAEQAYRKALELNPAMPEAWYDLALSLLRTNHIREGEDALRQALKHKPDMGQAWVRLGALLNERGDKIGAKEALEKAAAIEPSLVSAWYILGMVRRDLHDFPGAVAALETAARLEPSNGVILALLGEMQIRSGQTEGALKALREAERIDPKNETALQALSMYYGKRGAHGQALDYAERALEISAGSPNSWSNKGYALLKMQRYPEAVQAFETAIRLQPDFLNAWINLGEAYLRQNQLGKAIGALERALKLSPVSIDARLYIAEAYASSGQHVKAKEHLDMLLRQDSSYAPAWYVLTTLNVAQSNKQEALAAYAKLKSLNQLMAHELRERHRARGLPPGYEFPE